MSASIVIASYGRAALLRQTLESLERSWEGRPEPEEVLVVVSPTDEETIQVVQDWNSEDKRSKLTTEAAPGLSAARNRGILESSSDIIAFVDDDVEVHEGWLDSLLLPFADPMVDVVGGRVLPYGVDMPPWIPPNLMGFFSLYDKGPVEVDVSQVIGCNFAVRRSAIERLGLFDHSLGRQGRALVGNEEVDMCRRVLRAGRRIRYTPAAIVRHKVGDRLTPEFLLKAAQGQAQSDSYLFRRDSKLEYVRELLKALVKFAISFQLLLGPLLDDHQRTRYAVYRAYSIAFLRSSMPWLMGGASPTRSDDD